MGTGDTDDDCASGAETSHAGGVDGGRPDGKCFAAAGDRDSRHIHDVLDGDGNAVEQAPARPLGELACRAAAAKSAVAPQSVTKAPSRRSCSSILASSDSTTSNGVVSPARVRAHELSCAELAELCHGPAPGVRDAGPPAPRSRAGTRPRSTWRSPVSERPRATRSEASLGRSRTFSTERSRRRPRREHNHVLGDAPDKDEVCVMKSMARPRSACNRRSSSTIAA